MFICVGTSAAVQPAASLIQFFSRIRSKYIVNVDVMPVSDYQILEGTASEGMRKLERSL